MKQWTLVLAATLALVAGCNRNTTTTPSPKTDTSSAIPSAATGSSATRGSSTTPANAGAPTTSEKREGSNPTQGQVDPKHADQQRDFQQSGDDAGPKSNDTKPTMKN